MSPGTGANSTFTPDGSSGEFTVTASSGGVEGSALVTVTAEPSITVLAPKEGDVWYVGTTQSVRWTTANLDNIAILYSTDGGQTHKVLVETVFEREADWGDYSVTVPDDPSADCVIIVSGYFGEAPTASGVFEIRAATDTDSDGIDDGWERRYFADLSHDGTADTDGDGKTDKEEYLAGTDPTVPEDIPVDDDGSALGCRLSGPAVAPGVDALSVLLSVLLLGLLVGWRPRCERRTPGT
jgi:hypothetical protein